MKKMWSKKVKEVLGKIRQNGGLKVQFPAFYILFTLCISVVNIFSTRAQLLTPLNNEINRRVEYEMIRTGKSFITVLKPYYDAQLQGAARQDSFNLQFQDFRISKFQNSKNQNSELPDSSTHRHTGNLAHSSTWFTRKFLYESFIQVDSSDFYLYADPVFEFGVGKDNTGQNTYVNTRGFRAGGRLGRNFAFGVDFYENQAVVNSVYDKQIRTIYVMPGQGRLKNIGKAWDFSNASGYLSFTAFSKLNIRAGQGKHFIGDGYRSVILSDVAYNYPYIIAQWASGKWMYSWMVALTHNMNIKNYLGDNEPLMRELMVNRVLAFSVSNRVQVSLIENEMYYFSDSVGKSDFSALPFIPVMVPALKSNAHQLWGINLKIKITDRLWAYNQWTFDRLFDQGKISKGFQAGVKYFDAVGIRGLYLQTEYNRVDPYTYTGEGKTQLWEHQNEPLAHLLGNNFDEGLAFVVYTYKRWQFFSETAIARQLTSINNEAGYKATSFPYFSNGRKVFSENIKVSFYLNQKTFSTLTLGYTYRRESLPASVNTLKYVYFSFATNLRNLYSDF